MFPDLSFSALLKSLRDQPKDALHRQQELSTRVEKSTQIDLSFQELTSEDLRNFFEATQYDRLGALNLRGNHIGIEGVREIVEAMKKNTSLLDLNLRDNHLDDKAFALLADLFSPGRWLKKLDVRGNSLSAQACAYFSCAVAKLVKVDHPIMSQITHDRILRLPFISPEHMVGKRLIFSMQPTSVSVVPKKEEVLAKHPIKPKL